MEIVPCDRAHTSSYANVYRTIVVCVIQRLAVFVERLLVTDRRTNGHRAMP